MCSGSTGKSNWRPDKWTTKHTSTPGPRCGRPGSPSAARPQAAAEVWWLRARNDGARKDLAKKRRARIYGRTRSDQYAN